MTQFDARVPAPPLREWVALIWEWRGVTRSHAFERLMPNGEAALIVNLKEDAIRVYSAETLALTRRESGAVMLGAYAQPSVIDGQEQEHVFGIQFQPGGAAAFLPLPASELTNQHVALEDVWGRAARDFRIRLLEARGPEARFDLAEGYLRRRYSPRAPHAAVRAALREMRRRQGRLRVGTLAEELGLSQRRFIQLFQEQVGLTPKVFCRVRRFQRVLAAFHGRPAGTVDGVEVALDAGYSDQSHMIHDFRALAGLRPTEYAEAGGHHPNHVPVLTR